MTDTNTRWRKKPVVIDAVQFTGWNEATRTWQFGVMPGPRWLGEAFSEGMIVVDGINPEKPAEIHTLEGVMACNKGDWIIRGVKGELYPCKPDIFEATYEPANEDRGIVPTPCDEVANKIADYYDSEADAHLRYSIRNAALAFAIQNQGKGGDPKKLVEAAKTFTAFLEAMNGATDPVMPELKPTLKMQDGTEPPPHVARMIDEYLELGERRKKLEAFVLESPIFKDLYDHEQEAMNDQLVAMNDYYAALMRRLAYAGAMTS